MHCSTLASPGPSPHAPTMDDGNVDRGAWAEASTQVRRASAEEFRRLPLVVHSVLHDVPLHDVTYVDLPNGGTGRTVADVSALVPRGSLTTANPPTRMLFALRRFLGRVFRWDEAGARDFGDSYRARIDASVLARSRAGARTERGPLEPLYELDNESLGEARNATVHAFMCVALVPREHGYRLYWAVYVKPVSRLTAVYMAIIEPFRRFVVYPSLLGGIRRAWALRYSISS